MNSDQSDPNEIDQNESQEDAAEAQPAEGEAEPFLADLQADVTQIYLNEIGHNALLTPAEEQRLSRLMKQGGAPVDIEVSSAVRFDRVVSARPGRPDVQALAQELKNRGAP